MGSSCLVEAYPRIYKDSGRYALDGGTPDQLDAFATASWLRDADRDGRLNAAFDPMPSAPEKKLAKYEGWIRGAPMA